ncbi:hypothetical protein GCK32_000236 [Trichostrongylus colubriformis]|uniref:DUF4211 domain-containing protein n=1 Tax=Trichostrongylus colubriformis TaxID=6319 RepID=A0AAN8FN31_TRICO
MEHNNKHLLPGFHPASFPSAFTGLQNAGTNAFMSTLQQLSGLSAPLLPGPALSAAQWASSQSSGQTWIDPAKVAAMLPMYQVFTGVKGLDISQSELINQQNNASASAPPSTTSSSIFPGSVVKRSRTKSPVVCGSSLSITQISSPEGQMSNDPSPHPSTSASQDVNARVLIQPSSQTQAYDLTIRRGSPTNSPHSRDSYNFDQPSISSKSDSAPVQCGPQTSMSQAGGQSAVEDSWAGIIDLGDLDLFAGVATKENDPAIPSVFELGANVFPQGAPETSQKTTSIPATSTCQTAVIHTEITSADQEFDQIFSSLENNATSSNAFSFDFHGGENNPSLSPVQFTPPDSPVTGASDSNMIGLFAERSSSSTHPGSSSTFPSQNASTQSAENCRRRNGFSKPIAAPSPSSFKKEPMVTRPVQKCNKIPVYKQRRVDVAVYYESAEAKRDANDAYCFEDEEEDGSFGSIDYKVKNTAEVCEKSSTISGHHSEAPHKNFYVSGIGFALPQDQQKKRSVGENKGTIPTVAFLPLVHTESRRSTAKIAEPEVVTVVESICRRRKERLVSTFVKTEQSSESDCAKEVGGERRAELESLPRLPKIIIKLPRRPLEKSFESKKKMKKRRRKDCDGEWEGSNDSKQRKRLRRKKGCSGYKIRIVERCHEGECKRSRIEEERIDIRMLSKKRRLMMQWQEGQEHQNRENGEQKVSVASRYVQSTCDFNTETVRARLSKFGQADGHLPKGTFVVCKADLFRDDCALWRVDNQNMIQKYPPRIDPATRDISYKNSSTYSGWCDQVAFGYYRVAIKHLKQTRSEAIIQPEIPISDLFPAMTSEYNDANGFVKADDESTADSEDHASMLRDPLRLSLYTFVHAMINHALTLDFFQQLKSKNDWNFLRAATEIEKINSDSLKKLRGLVKFSEKLEDAIHCYTQLCITESDYHSFQCQCCASRPIERIIQLYSLDSYDSETLQSVEKPSTDCSPLPAVEFLVCQSCSNLSQLYHSCFHMKYHLLKKCEDKLEILGTEHPEFSPEKTVETARSCRAWMNGILTDYLNTWRKVQSLEH